MPSSYTDLGLELMVTGENSGTWGDKTNTNLELIQQGFAGYQEVTVNGTGTTTLDITDGTISNGRNAVIKFTGTITDNIIVTIPDTIEKTYTVVNGTSGAFTVEFKTVSGTGTTFSATDKGIKFLYADGTNVVDINANLSQLNLVNQNEVRFQDASGGEYVGLKAASTVSASYTLTLPTADGTADQALTTDASGNLSFSGPFTTNGKAIAFSIIF
jgi:hypothetical protein